MTQPEAVQVLFIAGASRSGSTLLDRMLGAIPGAVSLGEVHNIWSRGFALDHNCGCGQPFSECGFWGEVRRVAFPDGEERIEQTLSLQRRVIRNRMMPQMLLPTVAPYDWQRDKEEYASQLLRLYRAVSRVSGARVLVDSSKRAAHGMLLASCEDVDLSVIHLVRDSRAVAFSLSRTKAKLDSGARAEFMAKLSPKQSAHGWTRQNLLTEFLCTRTPRTTRLRYEDLMQDPAERLRMLASFALLDVGIVGPDFEGSVTLPTGHTVSGNPMRLETGPVKLALDREWLRSMSEDERRLVTARTFPLLRRYRYPLRVT